jgi:putative membrane protein
MRKISFVIIVVLSAFLIKLCANGSKKQNKADDSIIVLKNANLEQDTPKKRYIATQPGDNQNNDIQFCIDAASSGMTLVTLGKLARQKSTDAQIKAYAAAMVTHYSKTNHKLATLADTKNIILPYNPLLDDQKTIDDLSNRSGTGFDKAYVEAMIDSHKSDIEEFENTSKNSLDPDIKAFARRTLPILRDQLNTIDRIHDKME